MNDDAKSASILPYGQFVLAALALLGVVTSLDPLRSSRLDGGISPYNAVPDAQDVPARLWQDPFDAVADEVGAAKSEAPRARSEAGRRKNLHGMSALRKAVSEMTGSGPAATLAADEAEFVAREIELQRRGAFATWWKKPWFHSLLLTAAVPLGGSTVDLVKLQALV